MRETTSKKAQKCGNCRAKIPAGETYYRGWLYDLCGKCHAVENKATEKLSTFDTEHSEAQCIDPEKCPKHGKKECPFWGERGCVFPGPSFDRKPCACGRKFPK